MSGLRAEDVKEALRRCDEIASDGYGDGFYVPDVEIFVAAARAWLTPNYEAAAKKLYGFRGYAEEVWPDDWNRFVDKTRREAKAIVDAALGVHPQDEGDER